MILLWFLSGIALAYCIARYNKSNKLFWQLVIAFLLGYAGTVMCTRTFGEERSSNDLTQVCPIQGSIPTLSSINYLTNVDDLTPSKVTAFEPVGQDYTPVAHEVEAISSEIFGRTRDQPQCNLLKPPECLMKGILTHHDG